MRETLTSNPELFSDISWNLLLLGEETAKKWDHSEFNIEHIIHTLFSSSEFFAFIEKLSIDQDTVLDITEDFLEETPINESNISLFQLLYYLGKLTPKNINMEFIKYDPNNNYNRVKTIKIGPNRNKVIGNVD